MNKKTNENQAKTLPPKSEDFKGTQLDLFQTFICKESDKDSLSNAFDLWDSIPRYSMSRKQMEKMRQTDTFPQLISIPFKYRQHELKAVIRPAWIQNTDKTIKGYFPSANEELVEDALRKISTEQNQGYFDKKNNQSGVVFTLYMLQEELKKRGHTRSYHQITLSLKILALSIIEIVTTDNKDKKAFSISSYFSGLSAVTKEDITEDSQAKWFVQFHPLVTQAMDALEYRQFNYELMMNHSTQLARWLHKLLSLKYTFASKLQKFEIRYSTIKRDSALLNNYVRERKAIETLDEAWNELITNQILISFEKKEIRGERNKFIDIIYTLIPSDEYIRTTIEANTRAKLSKKMDREL